MIRENIYEKAKTYFLKPVGELMEDPTVSEIMIVGHDCIYFERAGKLHQSEATFGSESRLQAAVRNIGEYVGTRIDQLTHSMDARLPSGERIHAIMPPASRNGTCLTIRKFNPTGFTLADLVDRGSMSRSAMEFLGICVALKKNIVISGGTGTGKTSMLNALSTEIGEGERVIVIEDTSELKLKQKHTVYLEAQHGDGDRSPKVTIRDLLVDSLRMRPDRIVVGEVRRGEALDLIQSMITGHAGSLTTVHANSPRDAAIRLETLCLMSDVVLPVYVARTQVASAVDIVIQIERFSDGTRKIRSISEVMGLDSSSKNEYVIERLYDFEADGVDENDTIQGELKETGSKASFGSEPYKMGLRNRVSHSKSLFSPQ
ncbi:ATPase, T2SS/T4P/T4SS family [Mariniblastus sp.]|nr:ATPase, T2SS/T4P/T4SS family [Mariniblastus sp.]